MVISLERCADLHMAQLMPLPLMSLASVKSRLVLPFWYRLTWVVPDKGPLNVCVNVCVCVICRMAPFLMTLDDPNCRSCFRFLLLVRPFEPYYFRKYATDLRKLLPIGSNTGVDDCCEIGLRSLKGRCHDNQFLFIQSTQFFRHGNQCVINVVHSATTRSRPW